MHLPPYPPQGYPDEGWPMPRTVELIENLPIDGSAGLHADVLRPRGAGAIRGAALWLHGGGWQWGDRRSAMERLFSLVEAGVICVPVDYRLSQEAQLPAQVDDVVAALAWVRAGGAGPSVDPRRVALVGGSAGGHLALLATLSGRADPAAVVALWPPCDLPSMDAFPPGVESVLEHHSAGSCEGLLVGASLADAPDRWSLGSPQSHARGDAPPILLLHGDADPVVPVLQSRELFAALSAAGAEVEYREFVGAAHSGQGMPDGWMLAVERWLLDRLA